MYQYVNDINYAKDVCTKDKHALTYFVKEQTDRTLWVARKWAGHDDNHIHYKMKKVHTSF